MLALSVTKNEDLADYILRVFREKGITSQDVEDRAAQAGRQIARSYVSKLTSRSADNPTVELLRALADGLGEPVEEVFAACLNIGSEKSITRKVSLKQSLWDALDKDARQCNRTPDYQIAAMLTSRYGLENMELSESDIKSISDLIQVTDLKEAAS